MPRPPRLVIIEGENGVKMEMRYQFGTAVLTIRAPNGAYRTIRFGLPGMDDASEALDNMAEFAEQNPVRSTPPAVRNDYGRRARARN